VIQVAQNTILKQVNVSNVSKATELLIINVNTRICIVNLSVQRVIAKIVNVYIS